MDLTEVAAKVTPTGLLTELQLLELYTYLSSKVSDVSSPVPASFKKFGAKPREGREVRDTSWMLTEDAYKGFRPLPSPSGGTRFWLCVSRSNRYEQKKKLDPPRGYEWATTEMWNSSTVMSHSSDYNYYGQGGWSAYNYAGVDRYYFLFKDSETTKRVVHAGNYTTMDGQQTWDPVGSGGTMFAGMVAIKKGTWDNSAKRFKA